MYFISDVEKNNFTFTEGDWIVDILDKNLSKYDTVERILGVRKSNLMFDDVDDDNHDYDYDYHYHFMILVKICI